jgi:cytochrome c oxidase cbb3-type subunit 3
MADSDKPRVDEVTGQATTGHEWDGLTELNQPLPRWWLWIFYATIVWSIGYWIVYPAWPMITSYTGGAFGWRSRVAVTEDLNTLQVARAPMVAQLTETSLSEVDADPDLLDFTRAYGRVAFLDNCAPCHGVGGGGAVGYPNLIDDAWLWGGTTDDIEYTITHGIRNEDPDSRIGDMPAFGRDEILNGTEIWNVAQYVRSLSDLSVPEGADLDAGAQIYADNCGVCHGENGEGNRELGAPRLTDAVWLYGSSTDDVFNTIANARNSSMPAWGGRLDPTTIKALTFYVHSLGGGE